MKLGACVHGLQGWKKQRAGDGPKSIKNLQQKLLTLQTRGDLWAIREIKKVQEELKILLEK